jgi:iron complex transport system substrate-binding protein
VKSRRTCTLAALAAALALLAGCGDSDDDSGGDEPATASEPTAGEFPVTIEDGTGSVTIAEEPQRIVSLSPTATEMLFAAGAGDQVVAADDQSDYPPEVPRTDLSAYEPNLEAIAAEEPDLVIAPSDVPRDLISGLKRLDLTVIAQPAAEDFRDAYEQVRDLAAATGHEAEGQEVAEEMRTEIEALIDSAPKAGSLSVFHELDPELFSVGSESFLGRVYARLGLENVADPAAEKAGTAYPQLSSEAVVAANPDLVVLADSECCDQTPEKVGRRPGWDRISAVENGAVVAIDDDIASRWGPRLPECVGRVVEAMEIASGEEAGV